MPIGPLGGKLALVTGASGSIGGAIARGLAARGARVAVHYASDERGARATVEAIRDAGGEADAVHADLERADGAARLIDGVDRAFAGSSAGRLDILVNNAGIFDAGPLAETTDADFDRAFAVNVRAPFGLSREAARRMAATGWGRIISIGSVFGAAVPFAGLSVYSGSKFALEGLTRAWSRELGPAGITVNVIRPALINADPQPTPSAVEAKARFASVGRFGGPEEIAAAAAFLADPASGFINGASLAVDGGWSA